MNRGAVAIIDALGFKGIWGNVAKPSLGVLATLRAVGEAAKADAGKTQVLLDRRSLPEEVAMMLKDPSLKVVQLSDTIVVAAGRRPRIRKPWKQHATAWKEKYGLTVEEFEAAIDGYLRYLVARCVCSVLKTAALCEPALIYRGAITVGRFAIDENFLLGPAVDEAAELMDLADGPFVWLAPSAHRLRHVITDTTGPKWSDVALEYDVPLKGGKVFPTRVMSPFLSSTPDERKKIEASILRSMMSTQIDVAVKRGNAQAFFRSVRKRERREEALKSLKGETARS